MGELCRRRARAVLRFKAASQSSEACREKELPGPKRLMGSFFLFPLRLAMVWRVMHNHSSIVAMLGDSIDRKQCRRGCVKCVDLRRDLKHLGGRTGCLELCACRKGDLKHLGGRPGRSGALCLQREHRVRGRGSKMAD